MVSHCPQLTIKHSSPLNNNNNNNNNKNNNQHEWYVSITFWSVSMRCTDYIQAVLPAVMFLTATASYGQSENASNGMIQSGQGNSGTVNNYTVFYNNGQPPGRSHTNRTRSPVRRPPPATSSRRVAQLAPNISGLWRDEFGDIYQVTHKGDRVTFIAEGASCRGFFLAQGQGTISGNILRGHYRASFGSTGTCSARMDGSRITIGCTDTICGASLATAYHQ